MEQHAGQEPNVSGQEPQPGSGQTPQPQPQPAPQPAGQEPTPETFDAEYVKKLRSEAAENRKAKRELEERLKKLEDAQLTEQERAKKRLAELEAQQADWQRERQEIVTRNAVTTQAAKLGIDPELAGRLLDPAELQFDEAGNPTNVEAVLKALTKKWPQLAPQASGSPTNPARTGAEQGETDAQRRERIYGGSAARSVFDPSKAKQRGGGVFMSEPKP